MDRQFSLKDIAASVAAVIILTLALMAVYGWPLGLIFGALIATASLLVRLRIIR